MHCMRRTAHTYRKISQPINDDSRPGIGRRLFLVLALSIRSLGAILTFLFHSLIVSTLSPNVKHLPQFHNVIEILLSTYFFGTLILMGPPLGFLP